MAVAWNKDQVGHLEKTIQVTEPVISDLVLPRFVPLAIKPSQQHRFIILEVKRERIS